MNRISVVALASVAMLLVACPKKNGDGADAAAEAAVTPVDTTAMVDSGPTAPLVTTHPMGKPVAKTDGGAADGGMMVTDSGAAPVAAADAGPANDICCCKVGTKLSRASQTDCAGTLKGACVAKAECESRSCCCDTAGTKATKMQSDCSAGKGTCVNKTLCKP